MEELKESVHNSRELPVFITSDSDLNKTQKESLDKFNVGDISNIKSNSMTGTGIFTRY